MATPVTAIFDIGKTNKKFFLFDDNYSVIQKQQTTLDQTEDEDGEPCEDLGALEYWIHNKLRDACRNPDIRIEALNFSTYGASFVHLDKRGNAIPPLYNYLKSYPKNLLTDFYETYGGRKEFALRTASPPMGMLNSGLQLYWLKHAKPMKFRQISRSLHFPQYLSYLITDEEVAEQTSIGCHTGLWNFELDDYHPWLKQEDLLDLLPSVHPVSTTFDTRYQKTSFKTGVGIHDSSAALAPCLFAFNDPFILVSTGTWSITLNPFNEEPLTFDELQRDCLCYLNIHGSQVKAARLFLGNEYMHQTKRLSRHFGLEHRKGAVDLDPDLLRSLIAESDPVKKLKLETAYNSGPYPQDRAGVWRLDAFNSHKEAFHQLMLDLVAIQLESINLAEGAKEVDKLIITGGFSQNDFFVTLLASFLPEKEVYTASLPHASALGAAMVMNADEEEQNEQINWKELLGLKRHEPQKDLEIGEYSWNQPVVGS